MQTRFLTNQFLIAMPTMGDPNFDHTVTFICEHNDEGALGLVINRPSGMRLGDVFAQMSLEAPDPGLRESPVLHGGPVQPERGFVIHDRGGEWGSTLPVSNTVQVTTSRDVLESMAAGDGPENVLVALGYAGWGAGQLEGEMSANAWLTVPADREIIFSIPFEDRWRAAAALIGIDIDQISSDVGHA
ncbi:MAG: YqgE/AlgH family protein [Gammaproteobacteria bacterium]|jgi:putative transcriptional regulator|nr:MAG: YqgE/AlgH family protein [Gammaproteobacteria bacterium]